MKKLAALLFVMLIAAASPASAEILLVEDGKAPQPIFIPAEPSAQEKAAATALAGYLDKISAAKFTVQPAPEQAPTEGIFIGRFDAADAKDLEPDAFRIHVAGKRLSIVGGNAQGTLYGVFALLEQLGCRFWSHDEEDIPSQHTIRVADIDKVVHPSFTIHNVYNREAQSSKNHFSAKSRSTSAEHFTGSHTLYPLLKSYAAEHPEIYPMNKDGERKWNNLHFCYLSPHIAEALADVLAKKVEPQKGNIANTVYFAGMGDWYGGMCECADCKAVYAEETWTDPDDRKKPGYSATLLRMINQTAEMLDAKYPGIRVGTMAYMSLEAPPAKTVPRENVVIRVPRLRHCTVHAAETCPKNQSFRDIERWCELAPNRVTIWEYGANFKNFLNPFPCLFSMSDNLKFYKKLGIRGVEIQGNYVSTGGDRAAMKNYAWSKLFWNPELEPKAVLQEFCTGYYGPAADDMLAYNDVVERSVVEPDHKHADEFAGFNYLTPEVRGKLAQIREQAIAHAAGREPFDRRVREATVGLETLELWKPAAFEERGDQLARSDVEGDAMARAKQAIPYLRGGGANEWVSGASAQAGFLRMQGGPLVTLARGPVTVKVVPMLNGQIRRISYRDKDLLHVEKNAQTRGYPLVGGSIDTLGPRITTVATPAGEPPSPGDSAKQTQVTLADAAKPGLLKTVAIADDDAITVTYSAAVTGKKAKTAPRAASLSTVYEIGARYFKPEPKPKPAAKKKKPAEPVAPRTELAIEFQTADERWMPLELKQDEVEWPLAEFRALRITLPAQQCVVVDQYLAPPATSGKISVNRKLGTLTTVVNTEAPDKQDTTLSQRRIELKPLPTAGAD